jgi:hypothetical protein
LLFPAFYDRARAADGDPNELDGQRAQLHTGERPQLADGHNIGTVRVCCFMTKSASFIVYKKSEALLQYILTRSL